MRRWSSCKELNMNVAHRLPDTCSVCQVKVMTTRDVKKWMRRNIVTNYIVIRIYIPMFTSRIPGHRYISGTRKLTNLLGCGRLYIPHSTCKLQLRQDASRLSNDRWTELDTCWSKYLILLDRKNLSNLVTVVTRHCLIDDHAKSLGFKANDFCRSYEDKKEVDRGGHLLCFCSALFRRRLELLGSAFFRRTFAWIISSCIIT